MIRKYDEALLATIEKMEPEHYDYKLACRLLAFSMYYGGLEWWQARLAYLIISKVQSC
jgi:hypothetical protein